MPSQQANLLFQRMKWLSQQAVHIQPYGEYLQLSALLHAEDREMIGLLFSFIQLSGNPNSKFNKWLRNKAIPALTIAGMFRCPRTELTDLGYFIGSRLDEDIDLAFETDEEEPPVFAEG